MRYIKQIVLGIFLGVVFVAAAVVGIMVAPPPIRSTTAASVSAAQAQPLASDQEEVIERVLRVSVADRNCPRFRQIRSAVSAELESYGLTRDRYRAEAFKKDNDNNYTNEMTHEVFLELSGDLSRYCSSVWKLYGPNGTYERQMVEAR